MTQYAAGVDVGTCSVKVVLGKVHMRRVDVVDRREIPIDRDERGLPAAGALERALAEAVAGLDRPGVAFSALAGDAVLVRTVEIPKVAARRAEAILRREIEDDVPLDVDEAIVDHVDAPTPGRPTVHSLVVTVTRDAVRQHLSLLEGAGLDPAEVGVGAAVYSELARVVPSLGGADPVLVVDIGSARTETAIVEGGLVVSMRAISVGGRDLTLALAEHYRCSFEKAEEYKRACGWMDMGGVLGPVLDRIVPQLRQTMGAFASRTGRKVWKVILCGGASAIDGLPELLAQSVGLPVGLLVDEMDPSQGESRTTAPFLRATALAFRALPSITEQRLDLRDRAGVELLLAREVLEPQGQAVETAREAGGADQPVHGRGGPGLRRGREDDADGEADQEPHAEGGRLRFHRRDEQDHTGGDHPRHRGARD
jgi:type IV pilus assembly protein PilM